MKICLFVLVQVMGTISLFASEPKPSDAKALGKQLMGNFPGRFSLDYENGEKNIPAIRNGNWLLTTHPVSLVESFTQDTQAIAAIFVKAGDEFVRLCTTEPDQKPGSALSHSHPAYKRLSGELRYTDKVTLGGNEYMADYDVFRDRQGRIVGAYLVGIPILK